VTAAENKGKHSYNRMKTRLQQKETGKKAMSKFIVLYNHRIVDVK
jgi:hypothetical protein